MVSGFAGISPDDGVEGFARAPYALAVDVSVNGVWASTAPEWVELVEQRYDFANGELLTRWRFRSAARPPPSRRRRSARGRFPAWPRSKSRYRRSTAPTSACPAGVDPTGVPGFGDSHAQPQDQGPNEGVDGRLRWHSGGDLATLGLAYATAFAGDAGAERRQRRATIAADSPPRIESASTARPALSVQPSDGGGAGPVARSPGRGGGTARRAGREARLRRLAAREPRAWDELWRGRIVLDGADRAGRRSPTRASSTC